MWLVTSILFALLATGAFFILGKKKRSEWKVGTLALMLWGTAIYVFVDHLIPFLEEGGPFIEVATNGLVENSTILGLLMLVPIVLVWLGLVFLGRTKGKEKTAS